MIVYTCNNPVISERGILRAMFHGSLTLGVGTLTLGVKVKECIFFVNASPPKLVDVAILNFAGAQVT